MLLDLIELASNHALEHDSESQARLGKLTGKTLLLEVTNLNQQVCLSPQAEGLEISQIVPEQIDVTLKASLNALLKISRDGMEDAELEPGELEIIGDPIIGQRFAQFLSNISIDWESYMAERIGPAPAKLIGSVATQASMFGELGLQQVKQTVINMLHDDDALLADTVSVQAHFSDLDHLQESVDSLELRVNSLLAKVVD